MARSTAAPRPGPATAYHGHRRGDAQRRRREDQRLQLRRRRGDRHAHTELVRRYLPLARRLALRYNRTSEPLDDLVQVASLGLVKAVERWDPDRGTTLSTFAVPTILGELRRYFRDSTWAVRPPRGTQEVVLAVVEAHDRLWHEVGHSPTVAELASHLGRSHEDVLDALQAVSAQRAQSLDVPTIDEDDESATFLDHLGDSDEGFARAEDRAVIDDLTRVLDDRAREALRLRFGEDLLQSEIAERLGCSQMHVSRILRDSLDKLRRYAGQRGP